MHDVGSTRKNFPKIKYGFLCAIGCVRFSWYWGKIQSLHLFPHRVDWQSGNKPSWIAVVYSSISTKGPEMSKKNNKHSVFFSFSSSSKSGCYYYSPVQFMPVSSVPRFTETFKRSRFINAGCVWRAVIGTRCIAFIYIWKKIGWL